MSASKTPDRLLGRLGKQGFKRGVVSSVQRTYALTRQRDDGLYEWISCSFAGKQGEAAVCRIGASVTRVVPLKRLTELEVLLEAATIPERGWTVVADDAALKTWEELVANVAPDRAKHFADKRSFTLLSRTQNVRNDVGHCLAQLRKLGSAQTAYKELLESASDVQRQVATCLVEWPGVQLVDKFHFQYELACLSVVMLLRAQNLPNPNNPNDMPLENEPLMWEIQLVADNLIDAIDD